VNMRMLWSAFKCFLCCIALLGATAAVRAAGPADTALLDAQRKALAPLSMIDGTWRGEAVVLQPNGERLRLVQTERVGPMLDGTLRVIEGRGYLPDGKLAFNAFAVVSFRRRPANTTSARMHRATPVTSRSSCGPTASAGRSASAAAPRCATPPRCATACGPRWANASSLASRR
jgi:hypothetical protein